MNNSQQSQTENINWILVFKLLNCTYSQVRTLSEFSITFQRLQFGISNSEPLAFEVTLEFQINKTEKFKENNVPFVLEWLADCCDTARLCVRMYKKKAMTICTAMRLLQKIVSFITLIICHVTEGSSAIKRNTLLLRSSIIMSYVKY